MEDLVEFLLWRYVAPLVFRCSLNMLKLRCRQRSQLSFRAGDDVVCVLMFRVTSLFMRLPYSVTIQIRLSSSTTPGGHQIMLGS